MGKFNLNKTKTLCQSPKCSPSPPLPDSSMDSFKTTISRRSSHASLMPKPSKSSSEPLSKISKRRTSWTSLRVFLKLVRLSPPSTPTSETSSPTLDLLNSTTWERRSLISSSCNSDQSQNFPSSIPTATRVPAEPPTEMKIPATPMPPAHGANPPLLLPAATSSVMPDPSQLLSSNAPNLMPLSSSIDSRFVHTINQIKLELKKSLY